MKLTVDGLEIVEFAQAVRYLSWKYGFAGAAWDQVVTDKSFKGLNDFLNSNGVEAELELINA